MSENEITKAFRKKHTGTSLDFSYYESGWNDVVDKLKCCNNCRHELDKNLLNSPRCVECDKYDKWEMTDEN